jgi:chromosome segregation ATPase
MSIMTQIEEELHDWRQRADAAEKLAAGLEINLAAVIQRAEAAEGYLAELSPRYDDIVAERAELETQSEKWRERAEAAEAKLVIADFVAARFANATVHEEKMVVARDALTEMLAKERIAHKTEQTMHAAWRKRAEEAENTLAETQKDTARLDWLDKNPRRVAHAAGYRGDGDTWVWRDAVWASLDAESLRAAIDGARGQV